MEKTSTSKFAWITGLILAAVISRVIPHPFNFTTVAAVALFAGAKFRDKIWSIIIPMAAMFLSDVLLSLMNHYPLFHNTILFVYGSFLIMIVLGWKLQSNKLQPGKIAVYTLISSVLFFVITNIGVWLFGGLYDLNQEGLIKCFAMALPFFKYSLMGDAFFVTVLFGVYELKYPSINRQPAMTPIDHIN